MQADTASPVVIISLAVIAAIVPTITVILTYLSQKAKVAQVHEIVNSQRTAMEKAIKDLKAEVARLNVDARGTPAKADAPAAAITLDKGVVTTRTPPEKTL